MFLSLFSSTKHNIRENFSTIVHASVDVANCYRLLIKTTQSYKSKL